MATPSIKVSETPLVLYTLRRADDALILGHRLSEWCGHAPALEEDMDEMTVLAEARPERWDGSGLPAHAEKVAVFIKNTIGITANIRAVAPETLERSLGKAKRVYDKRPKG